MQAQQIKRSRLPLILIILGILESMRSLSMVLIEIPQLSKLYQDFNLGYSPIMDYGLIGVIILFALIQIIYGIVLMSKQKSTGSLTATQKKAAKILLVIGATITVISISMMINSVITSVYNLTNSIK